MKPLPVVNLKGNVRTGQEDEILRKKEPGQENENGCANTNGEKIEFRLFFQYCQKKRGKGKECSDETDGIPEENGGEKSKNEEEETEGCCPPSSNKNPCCSVSRLFIPGDVRYSCIEEDSPYREDLGE